ncbi:hypothetical protein GE061_015493 [Apolygus lucorum]|uniref:Uncharacterized protein n=1 Tax=Apolygus lucorum TaxID=248454 RepID=A0A6A4JJ11_APOLU|nr:hypothetical protein GE061_015493 [Apolygus lucorum]
MGQLRIRHSGVSASSQLHMGHVLLSKCSGNNRYTTSCFKLDFLRLMSLLGENTRLSLGPGVALVGTEKTREVAEELDHGLVSPRSQDQLNNYIMTVIEKYLGSLNLTVQLQDSAIVRGARGMVTDVFQGRAKKPMWILIGTIGAVAFALLAALTGQALMASILALIMSGVMMFRGALGGNFGMSPAASASGRITAYEIVRPADFAAEPVPVIHDHNHHHSALTAMLPVV